MKMFKLSLQLVQLKTNRTTNQEQSKIFLTTNLDIQSANGKSLFTETFFTIFIGFVFTISAMIKKILFSFRNSIQGFGKLLPEGPLDRTRNKVFKLESLA